MTEGIGDINSDDKGTGARYNSGKPKLSLIPMVTLYDEARVWEYGEKKYKAWNWAKGMSWSVPYECATKAFGFVGKPAKENDRRIWSTSSCACYV